MFHKWIVKMFKYIYKFIIQQCRPASWSCTNVKYCVCFGLLYGVCVVIAASVLFKMWKVAGAQTAFGLIIQIASTATPAAAWYAAVSLAAITVASWFIFIFALANVMTFESLRERLRWIYIVTGAVFFAIYIGWLFFVYFYPECAKFVLAGVTNLMHAIFKVAGVKTQCSYFFWQNCGGAALIFLLLLIFLIIWLMI